jgi:two-component system, chemotaxis family, CheB/CheR fusion protein
MAKINIRQAVPGTKTRQEKRSGSREEYDSKSGQLPIVGIGASAGGLEALELFLSNVPENSHMAFVVVQHLDPTREDAMAELLRRITTLEVVQAKDRQEIRANTAYIIPPNKTMSVFKRKLYLFEPTEPRGLRFPIDFFLRSLADDQQEAGIGVILSGMGTDGTLGVQAIREKSGLVLVQSPETAKFNSMPRSVIDAGLADVVAPASELPGMILSHIKHYWENGIKQEVDNKDKSAFEKIIILLRARTGNDFSMYKKSTIYRRIERRMSIHKIDKISYYVRFVQENSKELDILYKELFIGVTSFFRGQAQWEMIRKKVIPSILAERPSGYMIRAWVAGCSTGEEAYSLAIIFKESLEAIKPNGNYSMQIFATDIDPDAINKARKGTYPANITNDVSQTRLNRFFVRSENTYRINAEIREMVVFAPQNITMHPPFTKLDILTCRNLLIYLDSEVQRKLIVLFHYSLIPGGFLMLGNSETISGFTNLFTPIQVKTRIFRRDDDMAYTEPIDFPSSFAQTGTVAQPSPRPKTLVENLQTSADQLLLQQYVPAAVLINARGDILYINGRTGKYLEPAAGKANWNIYAMAKEGLRSELTGLLQKVVRQKNRITAHNISIGSNGDIQAIDLTMQWIEKPENLNGTILITFTEISSPAESKKTRTRSKNPEGGSHLSELELELQRAREEQQAALEVMQTSQEELTSSNEELQSTNEELQSTNEELTTSKEEMQSLNEELQTVNVELQSKLDELSRTNNDMKNLLNSTDIATLFLDNWLNIRRYTTQVSKIIKLIPGDIGRPVTDLSTDIEYPGLSDDANQVLQTLISFEKAVSTSSGIWYNVRIMPYRTIESKIDGVVITFTDITKAKKLESCYHRVMSILDTMISSNAEIVIGLAVDGKITEFNDGAGMFFGKTRKEVLNQDFIKTFVTTPLQKEAEHVIKGIIEKNEPGKINLKVKSAGNRTGMLSLTLNSFLDVSGGIAGVIAIGTSSAVMNDEKVQERGE